MKTLIRITSILVLVLTTLGISSGAPASEELSHPPVKVFVPEGSGAAAERFPLVVLLHGYMGNGDIMDFWFGYSNQVQKRKFILVVPTGVQNARGDRYWNATPSCCDFEHKNLDDVGYLETLMTNVMKNYPVDPSRVFVVGHSNGGFMAHRLACDFSRVVTGIISFAGEEPGADVKCAPEKPVSVLQIHALDDDTIRFDGDPKGYPNLAPYPGTVQTVHDWMKRDHCTSMSATGENLDLEILNPGDDTKVFRADGCQNSVVEAWRIAPFTNQFHKPHTPLLWGEFTDRTLDFIFAHARK